MTTFRVRHPRRARLALAAAAVASVAGVQLSGAAAAHAVAGYTTVSAISVVDSAASKSAKAYCPAGTRAVGGGGGLVWDLTHQTRQVVITQMQPVHPPTGNDYYIVTGHETQTGTTEDWWVQAQAICADPIPGMHASLAAVAASSASSTLVQAACPSGEKVLGGGALISDTGGQVGLQVARASTSGSLFYAGAHEDADGYSGTYNTTSIAICAPAPAGYAVITTPSAASGSEDVKSAFADCPGGTQLLNAGGATAFDAPGNVSLTRTLVNPAGGGPRAEAVAAENTATSASWDFIVAQAICAS